MKLASAGVSLVNTAGTSTAALQAVPSEDFDQYNLVSDWPLKTRSSVEPIAVRAGALLVPIPESGLGVDQVDPFNEERKIRVSALSPFHAIQTLPARLASEGPDDDAALGTAADLVQS